jgi:indoleamine 2,3-dioxygenase
MNSASARIHSPHKDGRRFPERAFLPSQDPLTHFAPGSPFAALDEIGRDLPSLVEDDGFREYARRLEIPAWPDHCVRPNHLRELRLYYVRVGFLASAYVNQVSQPRATILPANIARPLAHACALLQRPPILSYDGYALYNWKRFNPSGPIALGNIDTLQDFVHLYDEHWFVLVHVEIEAIAADILDAIDRAGDAIAARDRAAVSDALRTIGAAVWRQVAVLRRIPEKMNAALYYKTFRPYIRFFEHVVYEGVEEQPMNFRGETGAQSSIMPSLIAFMKIPHQRSLLTDHLTDMRRFMPAPHRDIIADIEAMPSPRALADPAAFDDVLEAMATFREIHHVWAQEYINRWVEDPRGTGGTPYMAWLKQLIDETRAHKISVS